MVCINSYKKNMKYLSNLLRKAMIKLTVSAIVNHKIDILPTRLPIY